jgi:hypothetical protein
MKARDRLASTLSRRRFEDGSSTTSAAQKQMRITRPPRVRPRKRTNWPRPTSDVMGRHPRVKS